MTDVAIRIENLGKRYRIGAMQERYYTLRESLVNVFAAPFRLLSGKSRSESRRSNSEHIWALKGVSFEVKRGEVAGIIGRNGAGKSTLLKILSRITDPTEGSAEIRGRVGSLLEVGTGFHPELTGRENVYLNGAILGMRKVEIDLKFDEIVDFAEVEKFLDTPVKRYSSGMRVRLAFAVAAHLEPEVLVVDEVLAVGDLAFQRKCLGKMQDVSGQGRTVLFVSHNMDAVLSLCTRGIWLDNGQVREDGDASRVVSHYVQDIRNYQSTEDCSVSLVEHPGRLKEYDGLVRLTHCRMLDERHQPKSRFTSRDKVKIVVGYKMMQPMAASGLTFVIIVNDGQGHRLSYLSSDVSRIELGELPEIGEIECCIQHLPLTTGTFTFSVLCKVAGGWADVVYEAMLFEVVPDESHANGFFSRSNSGSLLIDYSWAVAANFEDSGGK